MKYTLLDLTQTILSSGDGDEINSITDTVESQQVIKVIRSVYFDIVDRANLTEQYSLFQLEASGDTAKPVLMFFDTDAYKNIKWIKYNTATADQPQLTMTNMIPLPLEEFLNMMYTLNATEDIVGSMVHSIGTNAFTFLYYNDRAPTYYTSWDDGTVIFDAYDSVVDTTLQASKTQCYGLKSITWTEEDTFIPDLDDAQFSLLLNEAKSLYFQEAKQTQHPLADRNARRGWNTVQKQKRKIYTFSDLSALPDFGRH